MNLKDVLDQTKKMISVNKQLHQTDILSTNFFNPAGKLNMHIQFIYGPHTIFNLSQVHILVSMSADPINVQKQVNNQQH